MVVWCCLGGGVQAAQRRRQVHPLLTSPLPTWQTPLIWEGLHFEIEGLFAAGVVWLYISVCIKINASGVVWLYISVSKIKWPAWIWKSVSICLCVVGCVRRRWVMTSSSYNDSSKTVGRSYNNIMLYYMIWYDMIWYYIIRYGMKCRPLRAATASRKR